MDYVPVLSNVNYEGTRHVSKSPCCKILRYQSVTILQRYEYRTREFRVQVLCCFLCLSCSCSVNPSVSAAPSLVCDSSIVKHAQGTSTPPAPEVQHQRRPSGTPRTGERPKVTHATPSPGKASDATSSPGPPCQAAGTLGNSREVHLNPSWCVQRPRTPGPCA